MSFNNKLKYGFSDNDPTSMIFCDKNLSGNIIEKDINNEIFIVKSTIQTQKEVTLESSLKVNGIALSYNLLGKTEHKSKDTGYHLTVDANDSNMFIMNKENSLSSMPNGLSKKLCFIIKKEFIEKNVNDNKIKDRIFSSLEKENCQDIVFKRKINDYLNLIVQDLHKLNFDEGLNNIYLQSKVLELFFLELNTIADKKISTKRVLKLDDDDIAAIKRAKDILLQNIQNPPGVVELARMVAINDFKLKKGFKEVFNTTPYNLLLDHRMEMATKLLKGGDMNVNEISDHLGYKYTQSFSKAYTKKYGISPIKIIKNRKYYY